MSARNPKHENEFLKTNSVLEPLYMCAYGRVYSVVDENGNMVDYALRENNGKVSFYINDKKILDLKQN